LRQLAELGYCVLHLQRGGRRSVSVWIMTDLIWQRLQSAIILEMATFGRSLQYS
jgi:hypothetical protein